MDELGKRILEIWKSFPTSLIGKRGFCTQMVWASLDLPDVSFGFWCETNFKFLVLPFRLENEPHLDAFGFIDEIQPLKILSPYTKGEGWLILTLQNPQKEDMFFGFCQEALSAVKNISDEKKQLVAVANILLRWQSAFDHEPMIVR